MVAARALCVLGGKGHGLQAHGVLAVLCGHGLPPSPADGYCGVHLPLAAARRPDLDRGPSRVPCSRAPEEAGTAREAELVSLPSTFKSRKEVREGPRAYNLQLQL